MPQQDEVLEPEVLPPEDDKAGPRRPPPRPGSAGINPILFGAIIDIIDLVSMGPAGLAMGALAGGWLSSRNRSPSWAVFVSAVVCGIYCAMPMTHFTPLMTMIGVVLYAWNRAGRRR